MSLEKVLEQIKLTEPMAKEDVDSGPHETLRGRRGRKARAIETLKELRTEYRRLVMQNVAFILTVGELGSDFAGVAASKTGAFSVDPEELHKDLATRIPPALYAGKHSLSDLFDIVGRHLEDKARELGIVEYPQLIFKQQYRKTVKTADELKELLIEVIGDQVGGEIVGIQAVNSALDPALASGHKATITPIIMVVKNPTLLAQLQKDLPQLTKNVFMVSAGKTSEEAVEYPGMMKIEEIDDKSVKKTLQAIRKNYK